MSSQLHSGFIWVQAVTHLLWSWFRVQAVTHLLWSWFRVTSLDQSSFLAKHELGYNWNSFCTFIFLPRRGWNFMFLGTPKYSCTWVNFWAVFMYFCANIHALLKVWIQKGCVKNVGGGIGQDFATEVTHLGLNQPPIFFEWIKFY